MLIVSLVVFMIGAGFLSLAGITFRLRALLNKPAWGGATLPFLWLGLIFVIPGTLMVILTYNR
ncbi:MAG: hypothetical protein LBQ02_01440 [Candidatus Nomurabacteria bacterium]|nr:hypothetical protein [Candidatus Nomurabacteria bacterium]